MATESQNSTVSGWGVDSELEARPGVPIESTPPAPVGNAHWSEPELQLTPRPPAAVSKLRLLTPVYSSANPPRGLSGVIRVAAYQVPEYRSRRWLMLMLADRIDVLEHNVKPLAKLVGGAALVWLAARSLRRWTRS